MRKEPQETVIKGLIIHEWRGLVYEGDFGVFIDIISVTGETSETTSIRMKYPIGITA